MPGNNAFVPVNLGFIAPVEIAAPGAQTEWSYLLPDEFIYRLTMAYFFYECDGNAANRWLRLRFCDDAARVRGVFTDNKQLVAGNTRHYTFGIGMTLIDSGGHRCIPLSDTWLPGGWTIGSETEDMEVGDTYTLIALTFQRFREQN